MAETRQKMKRPTPVSVLLAASFRGKPAEKRLEEGKIWLVWNAAVGKQIAAKARPVSFRDGILTVGVSSAPWMQQLTFLKTGMIEKINECLGRDLVRDLYLKAGQPQNLTHKPEPLKKEVLKAKSVCLLISEKRRTLKRRALHMCTRAKLTS